MFKGVFFALLAAVLFGVSTPLAKTLLPQVVAWAEQRQGQRHRQWPGWAQLRRWRLKP